MTPVVEICVQGIASALAAEAGGADRVELCEDLAVGGVTPSAETIAAVCHHLTIPVHILIRPRDGDFDYSEVELDVMKRDIETAKSLGGSGIVLGVLGAGGVVDRERMTGLIQAARPLRVTFHKAFDEAGDPFETLEMLIQLGVERVLTSGRAPTAIEGLALLRELNRRAAGRIVIMAGGRITARAVPRLIQAGLAEIHVGSAAYKGGIINATSVREIVAAARLAAPLSR
jgi:copper homeostasis protein